MGSMRGLLDLRTGRVLDVQRVTFFVGPDMTGKTNIAQNVSRLTGIPYFKASLERSTYLSRKDRFVNELRYADPRVADVLRQTGYSIIFDRGYPCELVYSSVLQRETDYVAIAAADNAYAELGAQIVLCVRSSYDGIVDDIDPNLDSTRLTQLSRAYMYFVEGYTKCESMVLNVDDEDLDRETDEVLRFMGYTELERSMMLSA